MKEVDKINKSNAYFIGSTETFIVFRSDSLTH